MNLFFEILIIFLAVLNLLLTWPALIGLHQPTTLPLWMIKVFTSAISPLLFILGLIIVFPGWVLHSLPAIVIGSLGAFLFLIHIIKITRPPDTSTGFDKVFGRGWKDQIPKERKAFFLSKRYVFMLPNSPEPVFTQNISFYKIPGTDRQLLCDIWQPPKNIDHSGLAFIYLHGSAWTVLDKDYGTRKLFRHLANQGHVIMDVAYRLFPETDLMGMVHDAKHAIAWLKANAADYAVNPNNIIIGGGSAGGHIAMLAAYTDQNEQLMPMDLESVDLSVQGVISLYGQSDIAATYYHTCQNLTTRSSLSQQKKGESGGMPKWIKKSMGRDFHRLGFDKDAEPGLLAPMLGGNPEQEPEAYACSLQ
jgi:acetyl esterase/lipase